VCLATMRIAVLPEVVIANRLKRGTLVTVDWPKKPIVAYTEMFGHKDKWMSPVMSGFWNLTSSLLHGEAGKKASNSSGCCSGCCWSKGNTQRKVSIFAMRMADSTKATTSTMRRRLWLCIALFWTTNR
jgi:hypothetical protein